MATPGLMPNLRQIQPEQEPMFSEGSEIIIEAADEGSDRPGMDDKGNILTIEHPDGSISVTLDGSPIERSGASSSEGWFDNLVEKIDEGELSRISDDLLRGIEADLESRRDWIEDRTQGIKLLGLKIEIPGVQGASDGAPVDGMSKVRHPLLLEAVLRFQANARSELLPTDGPVKVRNDDNFSYAQEDLLANYLERDLNHYLTSTATEYYPDTDRMLFMLGFGGCSFKKVYYCPLRNRPVSESVDADDLIVNNSATDLRNAKRVTHRTYMRPSLVKRLQILGVYRDVDLGAPKEVELDSVQRAKREQQGIKQEATKAEDRDREIYECYCELNIRGFEHKLKGKETGLEIPYRVTIDESSKKILSIVRNYDEDTKDLPEPRANFVQYTFVPGMGFYGIGLLHILGNTTNAVTAAWREMLDAGMYANFPGFLYSDAGGRQNTNIFRIPPGGGQLIKTGGAAIRDAIMPLPYKEPGGALMSLVQNMAETGQRLGGTSEQQVGEGRPDAPVGTTLAMIEQATKILNAVHKRMHAAQAEEFQLLVREFKEHPDSFWKQNKRPAYPWDEQTFMNALDDADLVPHADPNTASHAQRLMKVAALKQMQAQNPNLFNDVAVDTAALQAIGWSNPEQFYKPEFARNKPPPELLEKYSKAQNDSMRAQAAMMDAQTRAQAAQAKLQIDGMKAQVGDNIAYMKAQADMMRAQTEMAKAQADMQYAQQELANKAADRTSKERIQLLDLAQNIAVHPYSAELVEPLIQPALENLDQSQIVQPGLRRPGGM
jgi:hypothetical protein